MDLTASNGGPDTTCCGIRPRSLRSQPSPGRDAASDVALASVVSAIGQGAARLSGLGHGQRLSRPLSVRESDRVPSQQGRPSCGRRTSQRGWSCRCRLSGFETLCRPGSAWRQTQRAGAPCVRGDRASIRPVYRLNEDEIERRPTQDGPACCRSACRRIFGRSRPRLTHPPGAPNSAHQLRLARNPRAFASKPVIAASDETLNSLQTTATRAL